MFVLLLVVFFVGGIFLGMPTARYLAPPSVSTIVFIMSPFLFLTFFSENPLMNQIRYLYLSLAAGIFAYWSYFQVKNK